MKKTTTAALCAAFTMSASASADVYQSSNEPIIAASLGGGYFFDLDEAYIVGAIGANLGNNDLLGLQIMHMSDEQNLDYFGQSLALDTDITTFGLVYKGYQQVGDNGGFYYSASAGVAMFDVKGRNRLTGVSGSDKDENFYIDGSFGFQQFLSENVAFNVGLRLLHLNEAEVEDKGVRLRFEPESIYAGVEAGLTFRF